MSDPIVNVGVNGELDEDADGNIVLRNTQTNTTVTLSDVVEELSANPHGDAAHTLDYSQQGHDHTGEAINPDSVSADIAHITSSEAVTVSVPGDEDTLQDAVYRASEIYQRRDTTVAINIESGHNPESGISVENGNWGHVWVTSDDSTVTVSSEWATGEHFIHGKNAVMPILDTKIDMAGLGGDGYYAENLCVGDVTEGSGVINAGENGLHSRSSRVGAGSTDWNGAGNIGARVQQTSNVVLAYSDVSNAGSNGIYASRGSTVTAQPNTDASNCGDAAVRSNRSFINVEDCNLSGGYEGVRAINSGRVNARDCDISGVTQYGVRASSHSEVNVQNSDLSSSSYRAVGASEAASINARGSNLSNADDRAIDTNGPCIIEAVGSDLSGSGGVGAFVVEATTINLRDATAFDMVDNVLNIAFGSTANVNGMEVGDESNPVEIDPTDTNVDDFNMVSGQGIIFKQ